MLPERFTGFFNYHKVPRNSRFLVAVSGGVDSVVLAKLCKISAFDFSIVHCNFNLRGDESSRDAAFVEQLAATYQVPYFSESFDTSGYVAEHKLSLQEAARNLRYQFFKETAVAQNFHYTLLAHHAGDNAETLMMHFFRGTGLKGLTGIPEIVKTEQQLLRPMLQFRKEAIVSYAQEQQLEWVEDQSNASTKYTRNFFRHEVLPLVKKVYPQADENLQNNINRFKGIYSIYQSAIEAIKKDLVEKYFDEVRIPVKKLEKYSSTPVIYEIIHEFGFGEKQVHEVLRLLDAASGRYIRNEYFQIVRHHKWIVISQVNAAAAMQVVDEGTTFIQMQQGSLLFEYLPITDFRLDPSPNIAFIDRRNIEFPLVIRKWKQGDYFCPLGMKKKKKIARFLIDTRTSKNQKEQTWVVESNKKILWVIGRRIDERFKVLEHTKNLLKITFKRKDGSH